MAMLTVMKGTPLAYNKDMQEDKEAIFDALDTVKLCITTLILLMQTMTVKKENMKFASAKGFINATDCAAPNHASLRRKRHNLRPAAYSARQTFFPESAVWFRRPDNRRQVPRDFSNGC